MYDEIRFDTRQIRLLRDWLANNQACVGSIGHFAQFRVVVDANFVIRDLIQKVRYPERGFTALEEMAQATVVEVFAPRWLEEDMASAIPQVASRRKLSEEQLWVGWRNYKTILKWDETWPTPPEVIDPVCDPKDLPYVLLEKAINASGTLSNDHDIEKMGGNRLTLDFVLDVRRYARASVVTVGIRVYGVMLGALTIKALAHLLASVGKLIARLPPGLKTILLISAFVAIIHPSTRRWLTERLCSLGPRFEEISRVVSAVVINIAQIDRQKRLEADAHLSNVHAYEQSKCVKSESS